MTFDEGLRAELITLEGLNNKVFPLAAPKGVSTPYIVYRRGEHGFEKNLSGINSSKVAGKYELVYIADSYSDLQAGSLRIVDKIIGIFQGGYSGPVIKNMTVKIVGDTYEEEIEKYRCDLEITVNY